MPWLLSGSVVDLAAAMSSPRVRRSIAPARLTSGASTTDGTGFATASVTPVANTETLLGVFCTHATAAEVPNSVTGNGLTWAQCTGAANGTVTYSSNTRRVTWFYASGASPSAGAVSIGFATSHTACAWAVISCPGAALGAPRQSTSNSANSTTVTGTLAALEYVGNVHIYALGRNANEASNPPAAGGWAELVENDTTGFASPAGALEVAWAAGDVTADPTWTTSGVAGILSLELQAQ